MAFVAALLLISLVSDVLAPDLGSVALDVVDERIWSSSVSLLEISKGYNYTIGQVVLQLLILMWAALTSPSFPSIRSSTTASLQ